jgi:(Z)-2-((N-methylformamido)methylene)-5-hydroxybutyrolactone dehydrogenase
MRHVTDRNEPALDEATRYGFFVDNNLVDPDGDSYIDVINPATGAVWAQVPSCSAADVDRAVRSARQAFEHGEWPNFRAADRANFLIRFGEVLADHAEELATLQVQENGKLMREMLGQTKLLPEYFNYYSGLAQLIGGRTNALHTPGLISYTVREPIGVVAVITPWNSPLFLLAWKLGPALAVGNTVVVKPSEITPVSTLRLAELAREAGLPAGVLNVVTGFGVPTGAALTAHHDVGKIAFTGSTAVGKAIAAEAAKPLKRVSLELGGKSPNIVFEDANLAGAVSGLLAGIFGATGIFGASGQTCMAGSRILVQRSIHDEVVRERVDRAAAIRIGDPMEGTTEMGTVASREQFTKVQRYIQIGLNESAELATGGRPATVEALPDGLFIQPTVFTSAKEYAIHSTHATRQAGADSKNERRKRTLSELRHDITSGKAAQ